MRVIQLLPELNEGGVERGVVELNREFIKAGIENIVISNGGKLVDTIISDGGTHIKFDVCSKNPFTALIRSYKLEKIFKELKPDILHIRSRVPAWLTLFANQRLNIKTVSTIHGFNSVNLYSKVMVKFDKLIAVSNPIKKYIQKNYNIEDSKIVVIHRGVDLNNFSQEKLNFDFIHKFREKYDLNGYFIISIVGRITQLKSIETLIEAVSLLKENLKFKLLIVGGVREDKQNYFESLQNLVIQKELNESVIFVGNLKEVAEIYSLSDVVVSTSKKPESFGRTLAEALALNTPVVATNHGGAVDIVKNGSNGFLFEPQNYLELSSAILKVKDLKRDFRAEIEQKFSLEQMVRENIELYKDLLNC